MNEFLKNTLQAIIITAATSIVSIVIAKKVGEAIDKKEEKKAERKYSTKSK